METHSSTRQLCYTIMILIASAMMIGRTSGIARVFEPWLWSETKPTPNVSLGENDRSRWATIRALVDYGTFAIGERLHFADKTFIDQGIFKQGGWGVNTDIVLKPERIPIENPTPNGPIARQYFYSSKPPLLSTILAAEYWVLQKLFGWRVDEETRWICMRTLILTFNAIPLTIALFLFAGLVDRLGTTDFGRITTVAAACFGTYILPFSTSLNNHMVAIWAILFAIFPMLRTILDGQSPAAWRWLVAGFLTGWAVTNELPAGMFALFYFGWLVYFDYRKAILLFLPTMAVPLLAFMYVNYLSLGTFQLAYANFNSEWYLYKESYWKNPGSLDANRESAFSYAFNLTFGHHGWFSLTPIMLLAFFGLIGCGARNPNQRQLFLWLGRMTLVTSLIVFVFYLTRTENYNYGGWTAGPRWLFWWTPLWLLALAPVTDWLGKHLAGRWLTYFCLLWSAASVAYPAWNPWRHPWLFEWIEFLKTIGK